MALIFSGCGRSSVSTTTFKKTKNKTASKNQFEDAPRLPSDLRFYQQVKLVNFIRRQIHQSRCYGCQERFDSRAAVLRHIEREGHVMTLPDVSTWDQPQ